MKIRAGDLENRQTPTTPSSAMSRFNEQGTTTTPFDMVVLNGMSRYHLAAEALRRSPQMRERAPGLIDACRSLVARAVAYSKEHLEDMPEIRDWVWSETPSAV